MQKGNRTAEGRRGARTNRLTRRKEERSVQKKHSEWVQGDCGDGYDHDLLVLRTATWDRYVGSEE